MKLEVPNSKISSKEYHFELPEDVWSEAVTTLKLLSKNYFQHLQARHRHWNVSISH
jgi:hypothetical protein